MKRNRGNEDSDDLEAPSRPDSLAAPPIPESPGPNLGMLTLAVLHVCQALYLLFFGMGPLFWGEFVAPIHTMAVKGQEAALERRLRVDDPETASFAQAAQRYQNYRWLHAVVGFSSIVPVIGLFRAALQNYQESFLFGQTVSCLGFAVILLSINFFLGWGGWTSVLMIALAAAEFFIVRTPKAQRVLQQLDE